MGKPRTPTQGPAWAGSTRRVSLPPHWSTLRRAILNRDGHRCTWVDHTGARCPNPANQVDHIQRGGGDQPTNLASLCQPHHARKSSAEGNAARQRPTAAREQERHPGLRA